MKNELKLGDLGVCVSDHDESGDMYVIDDWGAHGDIVISSIKYPSKCKIIPESDFWCLVSYSGALWDCFQTP